MKHPAKIRFILLVAIYFVTFFLSSDCQVIVNISPVQQGEVIRLNYGIEKTFTNASFNIELFVSTDGGKNLIGPLKMVTGDVGENIKAGSNLFINWDVLKEFESLQSDQVVFEIHVYENIELKFKFIYVKEGSFRMGTRKGNQNEKPVHLVNLTSFFISKYEVTQSQWVKVMGYNPSANKNCYKCPVENISYNEIMKFIAKLNESGTAKYRLPSEAEWEYSALGGTTAANFEYSGGNDIDNIAWYISNSGGHPHPVGTKQPNALGLYDMSGNVLEWCRDFYNSNYYRVSPSSDPKGPASGSSKVIRGGAFNQWSTNCTVFNRQYETHSYKNPNIGFRLIKISD